MPAITPQFLFDFESNMRIITENEYARLTSNLWYSECARKITSQNKREMVTWLLNTATIRDQGQGGNISFDDLVAKYTEYTATFAGAGLKLNRSQFEDLDGNGIQLATEWSSQIGQQAAYWPQKLIANLLKNGHSSGQLAYDGQIFFSASHPVNPFSTAAGTFSNLFSSVPVDTSVTVDVAITNLSTVYANIAALKMPNGVDPRMIRAKKIICSPKLFPRMVQLTNAKTIAQAAATGGGGADVEALIKSLGFAQPIQADELSGFESDTTYFVVAEQVASSQLGAFVYVDREPFKVNYYTGQGGGTGVDAMLDRSNELEWHMSGRNTAGYGHPFLIFKCKAS